MLLLSIKNTNIIATTIIYNNHRLLHHLTLIFNSSQVPSDSQNTKKFIQ